MKKLIYSIFAILILSVAFGSCKGDSYEKRLKKQKKAIKGLIADSMFQILDTYPADHYFGPKQYYFDRLTGVYIRVKSIGDTTNHKQAIKGKTDVTMRCDSVLMLVNISMNNDTVPYGNLNAGMNPMKVEFGNTATYINGDRTSFDFVCLSPACVIPLEFNRGHGDDKKDVNDPYYAKFGLGMNAKVSLIVPFENGSRYQQSAYEPFFYGEVSYRFFNQVDK